MSGAHKSQFRCVTTSGTMSCLSCAHPSSNQRAALTASNAAIDNSVVIPFDGGGRRRSSPIYPYPFLSLFFPFSFSLSLPPLLSLLLSLPPSPSPPFLFLPFPRCPLPGSLGASPIICDQRCFLDPARSSSGLGECLPGIFNRLSFLSTHHIRPI